ncbi:uncharacterized protein MELLADRAFT_66218 [Melampsora larici-populina 98AG31]|uniref:Uncharacterized protein n=1 Tax=Melampsora larici-populina (strain 98AG31 / pathotype 3-4-7) TaxID=747676 RepID=F4RYA8_MELLP|nr:uncharacterized protein MELLADRAFT_66218 [Melampsora larici-populina 98AG31]EGG02644.1 hypothetical protein MELLADRAFT_66218 [Melampsora larici-populina 98AG31]
MAPLAGTPIHVKSTVRFAQNTESIDSGRPARSQSIKKCHKILTPAVVIPYSPLTHLDARGRHTSQSSLQINCDSENQHFVRTRSQARIDIGHQAPAAKRTRRSDIGLDSYKPNQICLDRVTRYERPLTRSSSCSNSCLTKPEASQKVGLGLAQIGPNLPSPQVDSSHPVSPSRSPSGSRRAWGTGTIFQTQEPKVPPGLAVDQDDHSVVNEINELIKSPQDISALAKKFSTDKLLTLNRVTAILLEERLSKDILKRKDEGHFGQECNIGQ